MHDFAINAMSRLKQLPQKLKDKLTIRTQSHGLRSLDKVRSGIDFYSNDYLGLAKNSELLEKAHQYLLKQKMCLNGSTGSRLLSGNYLLFEQLESELAQIHKTEATLIFNSGYDANLGLLSCVPQRGDVIIYDQLSHASIRDGMRLSHAKAIAFDHNNLQSLENKLIKHSQSKYEHQTLYVVTESIFSMDGDAPELHKMVGLCKKYHAHLIVDEAHALGVFGLGLVQKQGLQEDVFARIITFGKALGCHGAVILGSQSLIDYLINFARSFIYTTALPPMALAHIKIAYGYLEKSSSQQLRSNIIYFKNVIGKLKMSDKFIESDSAIQSCIISGNDRVKSTASKIQEHNFNVKAILSPTVPEGQERLRFCIHSFNTQNDIRTVLGLLKNI